MLLAAMLALYGTKTSPYVRRVRVVCAELGLDPALHDTSTAAGQEELQRITPLGKVPALLLEGNHKAIAAWRAEQAMENTRRKRPDLLKKI